MRRDRDQFKVWCTYWLILHSYQAIISPVFHFTLHPVFQVIAVLWLSLPSCQGAAVVYERIVTPLVDRHEAKMDDRINEAHAFSRRFIMNRIGRVFWLLVAESGDLTGSLGSLLGSALGLTGISGCANNEDHQTSEPRHSIKHGIRSSSSLIEMEDAGDEGQLTPTAEFLDDFTSMLSQGLYVFARIQECSGGTDEAEGFKLGVLACDEVVKQFTVSLKDGASKRGRCAVIPFAGVQISPQLTHGIVFENGKVRVCLTLSDESDRNILYNGIIACLPYWEG